MLTRASAYLIEPGQLWMKALHDSVRDERHLVGMRLQDHSDKQVIEALTLPQLFEDERCAGK